jgi:hypothetical protein
MSETSEMRPALPYVSHLKIVKYPNLQVVYGKDQQGRDAQGLMSNQPSITVEITLYIVGADGTTEKAFSKPYTFYSKDFVNKILADIALIPNPDQNVLATKQVFEDRLVNEKLWVEDVLAAAGIPTLEGLWSDAFSDSLDKFPAWVAAPIGGVETFIRQLEWDARLSYESNKTVTVTMGVYSSDKFEEAQPERKVLTFEDGESQRQREAQVAQYTTRINDIAAMLIAVDAIKAAKALPDGPAKTAALAAYNPQIVNQPDLDAYRAQLVQEQTSYTNEKNRLQAVKYGKISELVALPSIAGSIKSLVVDGIVATLKKAIPEWKNLDMALVAERFALPSVE